MLLPDGAQAMLYEPRWPWYAAAALAATVQNQYNLTSRGDEKVLDYCATHGIGFIPWFPLAAGDLTKPGGAVDVVTRAHHAKPGQVALAWMLQRSPVMLPIPGTSKVAHLEDNAAAAAIVLFTYPSLR